jgi:hypothetical protein
VHEQLRKMQQHPGGQLTLIEIIRDESNHNDDNYHGPPSFRGRGEEAAQVSTGVPQGPQLASLSWDWLSGVSLWQRHNCSVGLRTAFDSTGARVRRLIAADPGQRPLSRRHFEAGSKGRCRAPAVSSFAFMWERGRSDADASVGTRYISWLDNGGGDPSRLSDLRPRLI